jgi:LysR family transcriptional regulator, nitrogen assimilation regulatory protein
MLAAGGADETVELRQIRYFTCLVEEGSVTRASRRLSVVQPAVSMQIAKLEEELGRKLFDRTRDGMSPTPAGRLMYRLFQPILQDVEHGREQVMRMPDAIAGRITLGAIASVNAVLARTLARFTAAYPEVEVVLVEGYTLTFMDWVNDGQIDCAIVNKPRRRSALDFQPILEEDLALVVSADNPRSVPGRIPFKHLTELDLVLPSPRHGLRSTIEAAAISADIVLTPRIQVDSLQAITDIVEETTLATILPTVAVHRRVQAGTLRMHRIIEPRVLRQLACVTHPRRPPSPAMRRLIEMFAAGMAEAVALGAELVEGGADAGCEENA